MVKQYGFYFNSNECVGCKTCVAACKDKQNSPVGLKCRKVIDYAGGDWQDANGVYAPQSVFTYSISIACMHCENALCVKSCPTGAMQKRDDGIVYVDKKYCVGCGYCSWVCPYGAPRLNDEAKCVNKCDFCMDLIDNKENPACVDACIMRCLQFGELSELRTQYGTITQFGPIPDSSYTSPSVVFTPSRFSNGQNGTIINMEEELL